MYYDVEVPVMSVSPRISVRYLDIKICGAETCYLDARTHGVDPRIQR